MNEQPSAPGPIRLLPSAVQMVQEFHAAYGVPAPTEPCIPPNDVLRLRVSLMREELDEYIAALAHDDIVAVADALADLAYVVLGTAVAHGLTRFDEIFAEVHRSNMSKLGPDGNPLYREDGKVLKGPNWSPPDLLRLVRPIERRDA